MTAKLPLRRNLIMGTTLVLAALLVAHGVWTWQAGRVLRAEQDAFAAQGLPMTAADLVPPPPPDGVNAAVPLNQAFILMTMANGFDPYVPGHQGGKINPTFARLQDLAAQPDRTPAELAEARDLLAQGEVKAVLALLAEAATRPRCDFHLNYNDGPGMLMPHLQHVRGAARVLVLQARVQAAGGDPAAALATLGTALALGEHLKTEPVLISQLVRLAVDALVVQALPAVAAHEKANPAALRAFDALLLRAADDRAALAGCMDGERLLMGGWVFDRLNGRVKGQRLNPGHLVGDGQSAGAAVVWSLYGSFVCAPWRYRDEAACLRYYRVLRDAYTTVAATPYRPDEQAQREAQIPRWLPLARMLLPALRTDPVRKHLASLGAARLGLALNGARQAKGDYPVRLAELVPDYLAALPTDPFTGKDYVYKVTDHAVRIYSLGPNLKDDDGEGDAKVTPGADDIAWRQAR